jgi:serine/threonine protein phosphatase 1
MKYWRLFNVKLFVCSDLHSFFTPFKKALDDSGFEPNNYEHLLIVCGDCFDRGSESVEMYTFLNSLTNVVIVRGNHEDLLVEMLNRGYGERHDMSNGTVHTVSDLADVAGVLNPRSTIDVCRGVEKLIVPFLNKTVNYFETKNYIFVHGWIPVTIKDHLPVYYRNNRQFTFNPEWRYATGYEWEQARWLNGIDMARKGFIEPNKTIVCGHWHCSYGHYMRALKKAIAEDADFEVEEFGPTAIWEPFADEGILAIDRCTAHTREVNVVVLEDELLEEI